jgi:hypothetical protein
VSEIVNRRVLLERTQALVKTNQPTLEHISAVGHALANVITDLLGAECRVVIKLDPKALQAAINKAEAKS